jgi:uncharacterized protein YjeT (DUF2065 family)
MPLFVPEVYLYFSAPHHSREIVFFLNSQPKNLRVFGRSVLAGPEVE